MNISYKWLKEYVDFNLSPQETAEVLTSCGLEVGSLEEVQTINLECIGVVCRCGTKWRRQCDEKDENKE